VGIATPCKERKAHNDFMDRGRLGKPNGKNTEFGEEESLG